jgi:hypothetical protein
LSKGYACNTRFFSQNSFHKEHRHMHVLTWRLLAPQAVKTGFFLMIWQCIKTGIKQESENTFVSIISQHRGLFTMAWQKS